jgi:hypothetical protein
LRLYTSVVGELVVAVLPLLGGLALLDDFPLAGEKLAANRPWCRLQMPRVPAVAIVESRIAGRHQAVDLTLGKVHARAPVSRLMIRR